MKNMFSPQEYLADYALDILEESEEFERELAVSETLQAELADFQAAVNDLAYGVSAVNLPEGLKDRLFDRLDRIDARPIDLQELLEWPISDLEQVAMDLPNWEPFPMPSGSEWTIWQINEVHSEVAFFLRVTMPGTLPSHWHATGESVLVLRGNFIDDGKVYGVGDLFTAAADTSHQPTTSLGCLILSVTSTNDKILVSNA
jgi:ChrR Cupin-like domain